MLYGLVAAPEIKSAGKDLADFRNFKEIRTNSPVSAYRVLQMQGRRLADVQHAQKSDNTVETYPVSRYVA